MIKVKAIVGQLWEKALVLGGGFIRSPAYKPIKYAFDLYRLRRLPLHGLADTEWRYSLQGCVGP